MIAIRKEIQINEEIETIVQDNYEFRPRRDKQRREMTKLEGKTKVCKFLRCRYILGTGKDLVV